MTENIVAAAFLLACVVMPFLVWRRHEGRFPWEPKQQEPKPVIDWTKPIGGQSIGVFPSALDDLNKRLTALESRSGGEGFGGVPLQGGRPLPADDGGIEFGWWDEAKPN